jgi:hypothetical protein
MLPAVISDNAQIPLPLRVIQTRLILKCSHLVDIFAMVPPNGPPVISNDFPAQDAKILHYQDVLAKMSTDDQSIRAKPLSAENTPNVSDGWLSEEDDLEEMKNYKPVKSDGIGPLLGGFADANSAME